ncbi:hypothetical protein HAX54_010100 [Datura stramonium]|uniref:Uncharacterized protein n=1 Tax=Datura stramonium TaxID=4076 RepID=A0ABS8TFP2_DATST|nr:hypothetical protein [Datura stramonium]
MFNLAPYHNRYTRMVGKGEARVKERHMLERYDSALQRKDQVPLTVFFIMSLPSSLTKSLVSPSQVTPLTVLPTSSPTSLYFENPFLGTPTSTSSLLIEDLAIQNIYINPSDAPVDPVTPLALSYNRKSLVRFIIGDEKTISQLDFAVYPSQPGPSSISDCEEVPNSEKGVLETSFDYLFEEDLPEKKGKSSKFFAYWDHLIIQSLTQMAFGESRVRSSGKDSKSSFSFPTLEYLVLAPTPKWDGTLGDLNLQREVGDSDDDSEDEQ